MEQFLQLLIDWGPAGMFIAAFLAGSVVPFSSEFVMLALLTAGASPVSILVCATVGNIMGGMFNYGIASLGREEWITRFIKVKPEKLERGMNQVRKYGAWMGLLSWVPVLGEVVCVALGFMHVNVWKSLATISIGKYVRYQCIVSAYLMV
jgi:membrane protein YqaA with SNARE-associated domain